MRTKYSEKEDKDVDVTFCDKTSETKSVALITLNEDISEIEELAASANFSVVYEMIQRRSHPSASMFLGKGRIEDLKELLKKYPVDVALFNGDLETLTTLCP